MVGAIVDICWEMVTASNWREIPSRRWPSQSRFLLWFRLHPNKVTHLKMHSLCLSGFRIGSSASAAFKSHTMVSQLRQEFHWAMFDLCVKGSTSYYRSGVIICRSSTNLTNHDRLPGLPCQREHPHPPPQRPLRPHRPPHPCRVKEQGCDGRNLLKLRTMNQIGTQWVLLTQQPWVLRTYQHSDAG